MSGTCQPTATVKKFAELCKNEKNPKLKQIFCKKLKKACLEQEVANNF